MTIALVVLGWLACSVGAYFALRALLWRYKSVPWSQGNRRSAILVSLLLGPFMIIGAAFFRFCEWLGDFLHDHTPASW